MKLRSHLVLLALGTLIPIVLFAVFVANWLVEKERETFLAGAERRALTLLTAVDAELGRHIAAVEALASVPSLEDGNLAYFRRVAVNVLGSQSGWLNISVRLPSGMPVIDLLVAEGEPLPDSAPPDEQFVRMLQTKHAHATDLVMDPALKQWRFTVRAPVVQGGIVKYVVCADVSVSEIAALIAAQRLDPGWGAVVLDRKQRFVSRNWEPEKYIGKTASQSLQDALARSSSGVFRGRTVEGIEVYSSYHRSDRSGWAVSMGFPASAIDAIAARTAWSLLVGVLVSLALAVAGAYLLSRRIAGPIGALARATQALGRGEQVDIPADADVDEIRTLSGALRASADAARERELLIEREKNALREADRAKDRFLAMLSHELRNPLAAISAAAHVVKVSSAGGAAAIKAQLVIERQTRHMAHLIGDLLDISRVTMGKMALERERFDLGGAVAHVLSVWRTSGRFERHRVVLETAEAWVDADRARIEQIVANLLDNALKFTPARGEIKVVLRREGDQAVLQVSDEGPGIEPHLLDRLFEPFVQGNEPGTRASAGLGVGLALVKGLATMHGGSVAAANRPGRGAVFTVRLPLVESAQRPGETPAPHVGGRHILLIEDDADTRSMLHAALELGGHEVRDAPDGATGLALAAQSPPDVAVIDIGLPDIDGHEVARRLRSSEGNRRIGLVALTGFGGPDDQRRALDAGFDAHLTKPVTQDRLKRVIGELK